jgi:phosphoglycerate dehydrogenase-like enzyme
MTTPLTIVVSIAVCEEAFARIREIDPGGEIRVSPAIHEGDVMPPALMRGANVLLCEDPPANFADFDRLQWMQLTSAGYSHILKLPIIERGIRVTNGLGNFDSPIAQWNVLMMLLWERDMLAQLANQKNRIWDRGARFQGDLYGRTVGFYGYGGIARETARLAKAMHMNVWAMTRSGTLKKRHDVYCTKGTGDPEGQLPDRVFSPTQMPEFLRGLDYFIVAMPLTPATEGLIGERELRMLSPKAVLINPARAPIVQRQALERCLREKWIRGASFDVHYQYPLPSEDPMWELPNLILTPHISGCVASPHFVSRIYDIFSQNCERYLVGKALLNELSHDQLQGV